jgi:drug/metabolite transporter, DME family
VRAHDDVPPTPLLATGLRVESPHMSAGFTRAHAAILATAALFSTGGAAIKACGLNAWQVASFRSGVAAVILALLVPGSRLTSRPILLVAIAYAGTLVSFVLSTKLTTAAQAVFLQAAAPLYVVFLERWLLKTRLSGRDVPVLLLVAAGIGLLFVGSGRTFATAPNPPLGNAIAIVSGVFYAFMLTGLRWLAQREPTADASSAAALWGNGFAFAVALPMALPVQGSTATDWAVIVYLGTFQIGLAYYLISRAVRTVSALDVSLLLLVEPVLNPLLVWVLHGEVPGPLALAGAALILTATAWRTLSAPRARLQAEPAVTGV